MKNKKPNIYLNELRLKSYLIRTKNLKNKKGSEQHNKRINQLIETYIKLLSLQTDKSQKKTRIKNKIKNRIIKLSEITYIDKNSYDDFVKSILIMIKKILTKPQFSGYSYKDDFYSDSTYKILKYIDNFDHTLVSKITGQPVNAFSYISQIIHNSIVFTINEHKKYNNILRNEYDKQKTILNLSKKQYFNDDYKYDEEKAIINKFIKDETSLKNEINEIKMRNIECDKFEVRYILSQELYEIIKSNKIQFDQYRLLQIELFKKCIPSKFYWSAKMEIAEQDEQYYDAEIPNLDSNNKKITNEDYPFILNEINQYIAKSQKINKIKNTPERIIDIIYDFSVKKGYSVELIGEIISSDKKLKKIIAEDNLNFKYDD